MKDVNPNATTSVTLRTPNNAAALKTQAVSVVPAALAQPPLASPQNSFILSPQPVMTMAAGTILTSSTPTVIQGGIQYTLQPATTLNGAAKTSIGTQKSKTQPQLLPKPSLTSSATATTSVITSAISSAVSASGARPVVTMATMSAGSSQQFLLNTGGVITGAGTAPLLLTGQSNQPILIQPPGGNPILVMRPTAIL